MIILVISVLRFCNGRSFISLFILYAAFAGAALPNSGVFEHKVFMRQELIV